MKNNQHPFKVIEMEPPPPKKKRFRNAKTNPNFLEKKIHHQVKIPMVFQLQINAHLKNYFPSK